MFCRSLWQVTLRKQKILWISELKRWGISFSFPDGVCWSKPAVIHPRSGTEGHVSCELCLCELWFTKSMALYINTVKINSFPFSPVTDCGIFCHLDVKNYYCSDRNATIWRNYFDTGLLCETALMEFPPFPPCSPLSHLVFCLLCYKSGPCSS